MKRLLVALFVMMMVVSCGGDKKAEEASKIESVTVGFIDQLKEEHKGKTMIVNFFASWCPPCRGETPDFVEKYNKYKDQGFVIVGLSVDKKKADIDKYIEEFGVTYPIYHADGALGSKYGIQTIPTNIIYKPDGKLFDIIVGPISAKELDVIANSFNK